MRARLGETTISTRAHSKGSLSEVAPERIELIPAAWLESADGSCLANMISRCCRVGLADVSLTSATAREG